MLLKPTVHFTVGKAGPRLAGRCRCALELEDKHLSRPILDERCHILRPETHRMTSDDPDVCKVVPPGNGLALDQFMDLIPLRFADQVRNNDVDANSRVELTCLGRRLLTHSVPSGGSGA